MQYRITDFEPWGVVLASLFLLSGQALAADKKTGPEEASSAGLDREFRQQVRPLLERFCLKCHSSKEPEADIDLQKFGTFDEARHGVATWRKVAEILDKGEMPPPEARQPKGRRSPGAPRLGGPVSRLRGAVPAPATRAASSCDGSATSSTPTRSAT